MSSIAKTYVQKIAKEGWTGVMEHKGFKASLMKARKLEDRGSAYGLPPGSPIPVFPITALPGSPDEWVREAGTYVCPVDTNWGIWFDWRGNDTMNTAVVPSVKGMNPITGRKFEGAIMESYVERCPVHDIPFGHDRLCEECGFRWPAQNYVTHESTLWWDGFRQPDGTVRQFFFTEDDKRDIASLVIGKKNVVPAFGFVFYEPKERRETPDYTITIGGTQLVPPQNWDDLLVGYKVPDFYLPGSTPSHWQTSDHSSDGAILTTGGSGTRFYSCSTSDAEVDTDNVSFTNSAPGAAYSLHAEPEKREVIRSVNRAKDSSSMKNGRSRKMKNDGRVMAKARRSVTKEVSVGAGARIRQELLADGLGMDGWKDEPSSIIRLYFCFPEQFQAIVDKGGIKGIQTNDSGFLNGLPVG